MLALVRDGAWELALLFHVLGAFLLTGGLVLVTILALGAARQAKPEAVFAWRRTIFRTLLLLVLPAYLLMRIAAEWVRSVDPFPDDQAWITIGYIVTDAGLLLLVALLLLGWRSARLARRGTDSRIAPHAVLVLAGLYVAALLVAVWAMGAKPA